MKLNTTPLIFVFAAMSAATYGQEADYPVQITESQELDSITENTAITNNSTLSITGTNANNWNVYIESGSTLAYVCTSDAFKWGLNAPSHMESVVDNYGTIDMQSGKAFRFGDSGDGYSTTLNLYDGSLMTSSTGSFGIESYRGANSIINVYAGAQITNLSTIRTWDRNNETSANPLFELNVAGGTVSMSGNIDFGQNANQNTDIVQTSRINVTNGGTFTSAGSVYLGNQAGNVAEINVSGEGSTLTAKLFAVSRNAGAQASINISDKGKLVMQDSIQLGAADGAAATLNVDSDGVLSVSNGTVYAGYNSNSTGTINLDGGVISQDSEGTKALTLGNGTGSSAYLNVLNGGQISETLGMFNIYMGHAENATFEGIISGSKLSEDGETLASSVNSSGNLVLGGGASAKASLDVSDGGLLNMIGSSANGSIFIAQGAGADAVLNVKDGGTFNAGSYIQMGNGANSTAGLNVEKGGVLNVNAKTEVRMSVADGSTSSIFVDGGQINLISANDDMSIQMGYASGDSTSSIVLTNGALFQQTGKNLQLNAWGGDNTIEVSDGAKWAVSTNFYLGRNAGSVSTLNVDGGYITGASGSLTSNSSDLHTGAGADVTTYVNITNGGIANFRGLNISQGHTSLDTTTVGGANAVSYVTISGNGSQLAARNVNNTNYHNRWGVNKYDAEGALNSAYEGNVASLKIYTGSQFLNTQGAVQIFDSAQVTLLLDSKGIEYSMGNGFSMFKTQDLQVFKSDDTVSSPFVIDGSALGHLENASEGDYFEFAIMEFSGSISLNGEVQDLLSMSESELQDFISTLFTFENNVDLNSWEDFDASNILFSGNAFYIGLTYVPEPSTVAAIVGALALAFAVYRRRK